ncbi:MAG: hypothetical protein RL540_428 [Actinomycetota bacterium]
MSSKFVRDDDGTIRIVFTSQEAHVVINLTAQLLELLGEGSLNADIEADPLFQMMGLGASEQPPEDPVLRRLLPSAYKDQKSASEFRRYTEHGLREKKRAHAHLVYEALTPTDDDWSADQPIDRGSIEVSILEPEAMAWLGALNDLRLALAVRLGISKEFDERDQKTQKVPTGPGDADSHEKADLHKKYELMTDSDPMKAVYAVYSWLGWLQQSLLEVLMGSGDDHQAT